MFTVYVHATNPLKNPVFCRTPPVNWYCKFPSSGLPITVTVPSSAPQILVFVPVQVALIVPVVPLTVICALSTHPDAFVPVTVNTPAHVTVIPVVVAPLLQL